LAYTCINSVTSVENNHPSRISTLNLLHGVVSHLCNQKSALTFIRIHHSP